MDGLTWCLGGGRCWGKDPEWVLFFWSGVAWEWGFGVQLCSLNKETED